MIRRFVSDLPYRLTQPMFREYEAKSRDVRRWAAASKSHRLKHVFTSIEAVEFVFALGIYYRYVVAPTSGVLEFAGRLEGTADAGLRIGGRVIEKEYKVSARAGLAQFRSTLLRFGLSEEFLAITDVKTIVMALAELEERRAREQD